MPEVRLLPSFLAAGLLLTFALGGACDLSVEEPGPSGPRALAATSELPVVREVEGRIVAGEGEAQQVLIEESQGFLAHPSPGEQWLALDVRAMSDLQVVYLFHRGEDSRWGPARNLSTRAWEKAAATLDFDPDDVLHPRTRFLRWSSGLETCTVEVSGEIGGVGFELAVELELR